MTSVPSPGNKPLKSDVVAPSDSQRHARLVLAFILILLGVVVLEDFLNALGWAIILSIATWPLYERFLKLTDKQIGRGWAAFLFTLLIALVFLVPLGFATIEIGHEVNVFAASILELQKTGIPVPEFVPNLPIIGDNVRDWWNANLTNPGALAELMGRTDTGTVARLTQRLGLIVARRLTSFAFTILTLFFIFRDGDLLIQRMGILTDRVLGKPGGHLAKLMVTAVRSTADGLVLVGLGEGALIGISYVISGVPHPALLSAMTGLLATVPFGAPVIFCAAALVLLIDGNTGWAIGIVAYGFLIVFIADHFIRPVLIGGGAKLPFLWVLLGIFGGLAAFGILGVFLGPAIMAALLSLWREWSDPAAQHYQPAVD